MRVIFTATVIMAVSLMGVAPGFAQTSKYNRCAELASRQGLSTKSASGRKFINRCMQRGAYGSSPNYGSSRNCPDDPRARSAYPAWMCR